MRRFLSAPILSALICIAVSPARAIAADSPNILLILVDDLGYGDLSSYGAKDLRSPNVDKLVKEGMRWSNAYANCCVCSPTRAALLSGRYQEMVGVPGVIRTHADNNWGRLTPDARLLPAVFKKAGYHTAIVGKWHLGLEEPDRPTDRGFDHFHGFLGDMMDDYYLHRRHGNNYMRLGEKTIDPKGHATDLFSTWAVDYIKSRKEQANPFFLYLAYNAPHTPIQPPEDWLRKVKARDENVGERRAKLIALIEHMDHGIGQVLDALDEQGMKQNTLVLFTSDNGGQVSVGARNGPLRDGKGSMYEGGIKVAMAARWPGKIAAASRSSRTALSMDIFPTLLEAAGIKPPETIDGTSFLPTLLGKKQPPLVRDHFFGRREGGLKYGGQTIIALRRGDWKLLQNTPWSPLELYNLAEDPLESNDLSGKRPRILRDLQSAMRKQVQRYGSVPWQKPEK